MKNGKPKSRRGRKRSGESRAAEIRARLMVWNRTSEAARGSLRALAAEIGTSHQLLSFYLRRLDQWQANEQAKEHRRKANDIRARADAENRSLSPWEEEQARAHHAAYLRWIFTGALHDMLRRVNSKAKRGQLSAGEVKMLNMLARKGNRQAQEILEKCNSAEKSRNNLPLIPSRMAKSFRHAQGVSGNSAKTVSRAVTQKTGTFAKSNPVRVSHHAIT